MSKLMHGDRSLWVLSLILALFSLFPVYSTSSNLAFAHFNGDTFSMLRSHLMYLFLGFTFMVMTHRLPYQRFGKLSVLLLPLLIFLLLYTLLNGVTVSSASRWIAIPGTNKTFQTSALAWVVLPLYLARYLSITPHEKQADLGSTLRQLILPLFLVIGLILPANFSTAALLLSLCLLLLFIGGYPLRNLLLMVAGALITLVLFVSIALAFFSDNSRVITWKHRIENFGSGNPEANYQTERAKMAITGGQIIGKGPGKSVQKNFLPQSNSDFIYAIIAEEFGLLGALSVLGLYLILLLRILRLASKAPTHFGRLATLGLGFGLMLQAFTNLGVAVNLFPVTGQTLPLISAGGSSIWMTCIALGVILSISRASENPAEAEEGREEENLAQNLNYAS